MVKSQEMRLDGSACIRVTVITIIIIVIAILILKFNLLKLDILNLIFETHNFLGGSRLSSETACYLHIHFIQ